MSEQPQPPPEVLFNNLTHTAKALGVAMTHVSGRAKATVHYASFAGTNTACVSIRASLHSKDARMPDSPWTRKSEYVVPHMQLASARLPQSAEVHMLMWDPNPAFMLVRSDEYARIRHGFSPWKSELSRQRDAMVAAAKSELADRLIWAINALTPAPVIPEWAERLFESARNRGYVDLDCRGDAIAAILVNPEYDWVEHVRREMRSLHISIPPLDPSLVARLAAMQDAAELRNDRSVVDGEVVDGKVADGEVAADDDRRPGAPLAKLLTDSLHRVAGDTDDEEEDLDALPGRSLEDLLAGAPIQVHTIALGKPLFDLGQLVVTPGFLAAAGDSEWIRFLERHVTGDWRETDDAGRPELDAHDINENRRALSRSNPQRILSAFWLPTEPEPTKFWIITEWDRSVTTCLLPSEY